MNLADKLRALDACPDAVEWAAGKTAEQAYIECKHGDWMACLAGRLFPRKRVVLAICDCVEPVLLYVPAGEERPLAAIQTARQWAMGQATIKQVRAAASAAAAAAAAARAAAAAATAYVATSAAYAVYTAADAAASAARAAASAAHAPPRAAAGAYAAAYAAARAAYAAAYAAAPRAAANAFNDSLKRSADIMRQHFSLEEFLAAMERV
jgi:hypothetical protein